MMLELEDKKIPDIDVVSKMSVRELIKIAIKDQWRQEIFERFLRYKEVQNLERIADNTELK